MDYETQLKLQAHLDGELPPGEARLLQERWTNDPEAQALLAELQTTSRALAGFEGEVRMPESREFFWSKVQRELQRQAPLETRPRPPSRSPGWRRWLVPAGVTAAAMAALLLAPRPEQAPPVETSLSDAGALTYRDYAAGTTLVWLSYPADEDSSDTDGPDSLD